MKFCCNFLLAIIFTTFSTHLSATTAEVEYLYSVNAFDSSIASYRVDPDTNAITYNGHNPTQQFPTAVARHPSNTYLYVASKVTDSIETFKVDPHNGRLSLLKDRTLPAGRAPHLLKISPNGKILYAALRGGYIAGFRIEADAKLTPVPGSPFRAEQRTRSLVITPDNHFIYAVNAHSNSVSAYSIDIDTGVLTPLKGSPFAAGDSSPLNNGMDPMLDQPPQAGGMPYYTAMDKKGNYLYITNWLAASVTALAINRFNGQLTPVKGSPFATGFNPYAIAVHPNGNYIYVSTYQPNQIWSYALNHHTGEISPVHDSPVDSHGEFPIALQFNARGNALYVSHYKSNSIEQFKANPDNGELIVTGHLQTRSGPRDLSIVTINETRRHVLATLHADPPRINTFEIELESEAHTHRQSIPVSAGTRRFTAHPYLNMLYVLDSVHKKITVYHLSNESRQYTIVQSIEYANAEHVSDMIIANNGNYMYLTDSLLNTMVVYPLNQKNGVLEPSQTTRVVIGQGPTSLMLDPADRYLYVNNKNSNDLLLFRYLAADSPIVDNLKHAGGLYTFPNKLTSTVIDRSGRYLFAATQNSNRLELFNVDVQSGLLTETKDATLVLPGQAVSIAAHSHQDMMLIATRDPETLTIVAGEPIHGKILVKSTFAFDSAIHQIAAAPNTHNLFITTGENRRLARYGIRSEGDRLLLCKQSTIAEAHAAIIYCA